MFKKIVLATLITLSSSLFAQQQNDTVVIKASGELAQELKALLEKYDNKTGSLEILDANAVQSSPIEEALQEQIKIDGSNPAQQSKKDIYRQYFSDDPQVKRDVGNVLEGKTIYDASCYKCHGEKAEKSTYNTARSLVKLSKEDIVDQLRNYNRDSGYGTGANGMIMRSKATMLSSSQINSVAAYIDSLKEPETIDNATQDK